MPTDDTDLRDKSSRGNASQFFIAGELCRRGYSAVVTLGNTPNVDILCSNQKGTRFAHIQVKTFVPGNRTCSVGMKAMKNVGPTFFWVLGGSRLKGMGVVGSDLDANEESREARKAAAQNRVRSPRKRAESPVGSVN